MKKNIKKFLYPNKFIGFLLFNFSVISLIFIFLNNYDTNPIAYIIYVISAYTLVFASLWFYKLGKKIYLRITKNKIYRIYKDDLNIQIKVNLYFSVIINTIYGLLKLLTGIYYQSAWFTSFAFYYLLLSTMRFLILKDVGKNNISLTKEFKKFRICGFILLFMNFILSGIIILIIRHNHTFEYPGYLIYLIALYDFYLIINAFIKVFKHRKNNSPLVIASKCINLTVAMISMISLETAMLTQFGSNDDFYFNTVVIACTGFGVCLVNSIMSVIMIWYSNKNIKLQLYSK